MADEEVRQQVERADAFIADFRALIASTAVDPARLDEVACRRGLDRIADTVDAVDYVSNASLATSTQQWCLGSSSAIARAASASRGHSPHSGQALVGTANGLATQPLPFVALIRGKRPIMLSPKVGIVDHSSARHMYLSGQVFS